MLLLFILKLLFLCCISKLNLGEKQTQLTILVCPKKVCDNSPVKEDQILIFLSLLPLAINYPSFINIKNNIYVIY